VSAAGAAFSADLGGSSEYSSVAISLKTEVEKGSSAMVNSRGLVGPKHGGNVFYGQKGAGLF